MESAWDTAGVSCPNCAEMLTLRPEIAEIWCGRCEEGYDITESRNPRDPDRIVLVLAKKRQMTDRM
jgi:hypothetical protein